MLRLSNTFSYCTSNGVPRRSLLVALIVGSVLNLINQGDELFRVGKIKWAKLVLTYAVPYFVATYGAVSYRMMALRECGAAVATDREPVSLSQ